MSEKFECEFCGEEFEDDEGFYAEIYHPFDNSPDFEGYICEDCYYETCDYCCQCEREIFKSNGMRINIRYDDKIEDVICVKCLQDYWFEEGMEKFRDADFFNYSDLKDNGFYKYSSHFCPKNYSYEEVEDLFNELKERGYLVIVNIDADGMGLEHHLSLWVKEVDK